MTMAILVLVAGGGIWMICCLALARLRGRQIEREIAEMMEANSNLRFDSPPKLSDAQLNKLRAKVRELYPYGKN